MFNNLTQKQKKLYLLLVKALKEYKSVRSGIEKQNEEETKND